jgi:hypothetical protein
MHDNVLRRIPIRTIFFKRGNRTNKELSHRLTINLMRQFYK